jgi:hypothetical protein
MWQLYQIDVLGVKIPLGVTRSIKNSHTQSMCALVCVLHESENSDYFVIEHQLIVFYNQVVGLTVTYASETRVFKENMINTLMIFERKIVRKIFGPTRSDDVYCRIKTNQEINDILKGQNVIGFIKKQRLNWLGHVERMADDNNARKINRWKPISKRPTGRPKTHWEDDVLEDIKSVNVRNWKKVAQNTDSWKKVDEQARTLYGL